MKVSYNSRQLYNLYTGIWGRNEIHDTAEEKLSWKNPIEFLELEAKHEHEKNYFIDF